ncbi:MAG: hypothetical protein OHK0028_16300 [Deltaproteobacteria bacterium]
MKILHVQWHIRMISAAMLLLAMAGGPSAGRAFGGEGRIAIHRSPGKSLLLALRISKAKKMEQRVAYFKSVARLRISGAGTGSRRRMSATAGKPPRAAGRKPSER